MTSLLGVAGMLGRGGTPAERARGRLMTAGTALATWFLFAAANVLALRGQVNGWLGPASDRGTRPGTALAVALMVLPVAAFLHQASRLAAADRERRLSALRLAGAAPAQVRLLGVLETTRAGVTGAVIGAVSYLLLQWAGRKLLLGPGSHLDVNVPPLLCAAAVALVVITAAVSGLLVGRHVVATPLGVTVRANRRRPRGYPIALLVPGLFLLHAMFRPWGVGLAGLALIAIGLPLSQGRLIWISARIAGRRARTAETLLAARVLEADARPWGRTLSVVGLAVAICSATGWLEASTLEAGRMTEPFFLSSYILVDLGLLVVIAVAASALLVHQAEYLLEHGPVLAALQAAGIPETALRRVMIRQALLAATPVCLVSALIGLITLGAPAAPPSWLLWVMPRALIAAGLGVLGAVLVAVLSRSRLRRTVAPARLRTE